VRTPLRVAQRFEIVAVEPGATSAGAVPVLPVAVAPVTELPAPPLAGRDVLVPELPGSVPQPGSARAGAAVDAAIRTTAASAQLTDVFLTARS
jgi:hypothetical protein